MNIEQFEINGHTVEIFHDLDAPDPREWDNLGHMICSHSRYDLGDEQIPDGDWRSWSDIKEFLAKDRLATIILPLYLFDHSGLSMATTSDGMRAMDPGRWDWARVGFIYTTEHLLKKMGLEGRVSSEIESYLRQEVRTYSAYLEGNCYVFTVKNPYGEVVESCGGYYDMDSVIREGKASAERMQKPDPQERFTRAVDAFVDEWKKGS